MWCGIGSKWLVTFNLTLLKFFFFKGYLIIYVTARPDMQQRLVAHWLAQHNFPHGLLFFTPSFSTDPLKYFLILLSKLVNIFY